MTNSVTLEHTRCLSDTVRGGLLRTPGGPTGAQGPPRRAGRAGGGLGQRRYIHLWLIHIAVRRKPTQYCKATILQ